MTMHQNGLGSINGLLVTPHKGMGHCNVLQRVCKTFKRGMDSKQRSNHHER